MPNILKLHTFPNETSLQPIITSQEESEYFPLLFYVCMCVCIISIDKSSTVDDVY